MKDWEGINLTECYGKWFKQKPEFTSMLPSLICWNVWLERNKVIFENGFPSIYYVVFKSLGTFNRLSFIQKVPSIWFNLPHLQIGATVGWFDGAAHPNGQLSGVAGVIRIFDQIVYKWNFNCGADTNTREELLGV